MRRPLDGPPAEPVGGSPFAGGVPDSTMFVRVAVDEGVPASTIFVRVGVEVAVLTAVRVGVAE